MTFTPYGVSGLVLLLLVVIVVLIFSFTVFVSMGLLQWFLKPEGMRPPWKDWGLDEPKDDVPAAQPRRKPGR